jgi:hypothetical protein
MNMTKLRYFVRLFGPWFDVSTDLRLGEGRFEDQDPNYFN